MMDQFDILTIINEHYPLCFDKLEFMRDAGSVSYTVFSEKCKYFLRITKPAMFDVARNSLSVHIFLQNQSFPVPTIIYTKDSSPSIQISQEDGEHLFILYEFIEGVEVNLEQDAEKIGALVGMFHSVMKNYSEPLLKRDKYYYVDKYLDQMRLKQYPRVNEFAAYGNSLWERVKDLPRGYCHGDLYSGNIHKASDGKLYILDFDTSCEGFPMYDPVLICNMTDFFELEEDGYYKCQKIFKRFLPEYLKYTHLTQKEIDAFYDLNALYHFALQAAILDIFGLNCIDHMFLDQQLNYLYKWQKQCDENKYILELRTDDLTLKTITDSDIDEVARMWNFENGSISKEEAKEAIEYMQNNHRRNHLGYIYHLCLAVFKNGGSKIIGWCGLDGEVDGKLHIFYSIDENHRNKGYATQCAKRLLSYAFDEVKVPFVNGGCAKDNIASYKVMRKIGMVQNGFEEDGAPLFFMDDAMYHAK